MTQGTWQFLGTIAAGLIGFVGIWLSIRKDNQKTRTDAATELLNQLQEERDALTQRIENLEKKLGVAEKELRASRRRELDRDDFLQELRTRLRDHGEDPPPWPEALRNA